MTTTDNNQKPLLLLPPGQSESPLNNGEKTAAPEKDAKTGQFVSGNVGGPGRPLGSRNFTTKIKAGLARLAAKDAQGNKLPVEDALVDKVIKMALAGDRKMIELIWNHLDGKPPQSIDLTSQGQHINKRKLSDEEIERVDRIFAPKDWEDDEENALSYGPITHQSKTKEKTGGGDAQQPQADSGNGPRQSQKGNA